jgi:hypothetical protein
MYRLYQYCDVSQPILKKASGPSSEEGAAARYKKMQRYLNQRDVRGGQPLAPAID